MKLTFVYVVALTGMLNTVSTDAARILAIYPMPAKSHHSFHYGIMKVLHAAGHHITMISPFPPETKIDNFTHIDSRSNTAILIGISTIESFHAMKLHHLMNFVQTSDMKYCHDVINLKEIREALDSTQTPYDIVLTEIRMCYECYLPTAEKLGIPVIGTTSMINWRPADYVVGTPHNPAVIPLGLLTSKPDMDFFERVQNTWNSFVVYYYREKLRATMENFYRKYYSEDLLYKKEVSMVFYNNHASLFPRAIPPNAIEIGGFHIQPANPLPKDLKKFIDEAPHGVILFTFGSIVRTASLPSKQKNAFLTALASVPQRVIWKHEEPIENLPENMMISSWLPQRDILEHKNVILFMSHCGQSGLYEAVITGTPIIAIPLFGDQIFNAALLRRRKVGLDLDIDTVTKESVLAALNTIINDTSYHQRMQELSREFKDRPKTPEETIVYWTEYVIRHGGAPHLRALGTDMPLYQHFMLDILIVAFIILSIFIFLTWRMVAYIKIRYFKNEFYNRNISENKMLHRRILKFNPPDQFSHLSEPIKPSATDTKQEQINLITKVIMVILLMFLITEISMGWNGILWIPSRNLN